MKLFRLLSLTTMILTLSVSSIKASNPYIPTTMGLKLKYEVRDKENNLTGYNALRVTDITETADGLRVEMATKTLDKNEELVNRLGRDLILMSSGLISKDKVVIDLSSQIASTVEAALSSPP